MLKNFFIRKNARSRVSPESRGLQRLTEFNISSASCLLIQTSDGDAVDQDLGRASLFRSEGRLLIRGGSVFVTPPDGIRADRSGRFQGPGDVVRLWFLHQRIPRIVECRIEEHLRLGSEEAPGLDPRAGLAYRLTLLSDVRKLDKRSALRFSHRPGSGALPVYPQILFDVFATRTSLVLSAEGAPAPWVEDVEQAPSAEAEADEERGPLDLEGMVEQFKDGMRANPAEDRTVHVGKPYTDERHDRTFLLDLGSCDVLGLGSEEVSRSIHIKKPGISRTKDRRDPHYLTVGDTIVLTFGTRSPLSGRYDYAGITAEVVKGGLENIAIRPVSPVRPEGGLRLDLLDFSMNGFRFEATPEFLSYALPPHARGLPILGRLDHLCRSVLLFDFYPRLRFSRETDAYRPDLPRRIPVLGRIVRSEIDWEGDSEPRHGRFRSFGVRFAYDPTDYSRKDDRYTRSEAIRPFKENRHFKEVHKALNGLIAFLESHGRDSGPL